VQAVNAIDTPESEAFFAALLAAAGIERPADWRERVIIGADRRQSRTARENLKLPAGLEFPASLPETQRRLVEFHAPGLRALLGYA
jgi:isopenicillin N synthase-like dioxygenase